MFIISETNKFDTIPFNIERNLSLDEWILEVENEISIISKWTIEIINSANSLIDIGIPNSS